MIETLHAFDATKNPVVDKIVMDENVNIIHMQFDQGGGLPVHHANSNVYMTVLGGKLSITLDEQETQVYERGALLQIPYNTKMHVRNEDEDQLELMVVKAPAPSAYKG